MADRSWTPSLGLVAGLSLAQTALWSLPALLGVRSTIDAATGPLLARASDALTWLALGLLYGGVGLLGGVTGLALSLRAWKGPGARSARRRAARGAWWANLAAAALQLVLWIAFFLLAGSTHGR